MNIFKIIYELKSKLFSPSSQKQAPVILKEYNTYLCRLLQLKPGSQAIASWRAILKYGNYDVLLTCRRCPPEYSGATNETDTGEYLLPLISHEIFVNRISRYPNNGQIKVDLLWCGSFDLVGMEGLVRNIRDRFAIRIVRGLALDLLKLHLQEIIWINRLMHYVAIVIGPNHTP